MRAGGARVVLVGGELSPADATGDDDDDGAAGASEAARGGHGGVRGAEDEGGWARHSDKGTSCPGNNKDDSALSYHETRKWFQFISPMYATTMFNAGGSLVGRLQCVMWYFRCMPFCFSYNETLCWCENSATALGPCLFLLILFP